MRRRIKRLTAGIMTMVMLGTSSLVNMMPQTAKKAEAATLYISEVKVGMGETADEAKKELEKEGYTILKDSSGNNADLNDGAGTSSMFKEGANDKIVYLGYKTTEDPNDAITDLAVMNMEGGYSIDDYNKLMDEQMESQIKPFVDRFISTLEEYRTNYNKSKKTKNYKRANYVRQMLNRLTDDDTGGKPLGDLLLNKTKYEMGDDAYNKLSDSEKKNHADILTILMQANGQATLTIETLITKATDTGNDSWVDRFRETTLDDLVARMQSEDKSLKTKGDVMSALDRRYYDTAKNLLGKWQYFQENISDYEGKAEELVDNAEDVEERMEEVNENDYGEMVEESIENGEIGDDEQDAIDTLNEANDQVFDQAIDAQFVAIGAYLDSLEYGDGTMLEFFEQDYDEVSGNEGIRQLYPIVDALTDGQIAGLEFVSFTDLFQIALSDENTYKEVSEMSGDIEQTSIYENVDRAIYEKGMVAMTNDALRAKARASEVENAGFKASTLTMAMWGITVGFAVATVATTVVSKVMSSVPTAVRNIPAMYKGVWNSIDGLMKAQTETLASINRVSGVNAYGIERMIQDQALDGYCKTLDSLGDRISELQEAKNAGKVGGSVAGKLAICMAVITVILTVISTVMTVLEAKEYYHTKYIPIPKYMVEEADITAYNEKGERIMLKNQTAYYKVVKCNRTAGDSSITRENYEAMADNNDLNGDIGRQWLALYSVKYQNGTPILADSLLYQKNSDKVPKGYSNGIHMFGDKSDDGYTAFNLNYKHYLYNEDAPTIKVFFKNEKKTVRQLSGTGSLFGVGSLAIGCFGLLAGALLGGIGVWFMARRKKEVAVG
jgi:hypothetical protein